MQSDESNPIKDYLFEYIKSSDTIPSLLTQKKFDEIVLEIIKNCYDKIVSLGAETGNKDESIGVMATGLLHYLLTNALITSQRKIDYNGIELDIVIPDVKTLEKDPKKTLLICIPKSSDKKIIEDKISQLEKIQPEKDNLWLVLSDDVQIDKKSFVLTKDANAFSKIIFEIAQFTNVNAASKFKILRI